MPGRSSLPIEEAEIKTDLTGITDVEKCIN
jgi:hypothetical protein